VEGASGKCSTGRSEKRLNSPGQETNYETKATVIQLLLATITVALFDSSLIKKYTKIKESANSVDRGAFIAI
jgi:hypothetical protein